VSPDVASPEHFFTLRFGPELADVCTPPATAAQLTTSAEHELALLLRRLGIPAAPVVTLEANPLGTGLQLLVEGVPLPVPAAEVRRLEQLHGGSDPVRFCTALVARAAEANAAALLGERQSQSWIERALLAHPEAEPIARYAECTRTVLRAQLAQGIPLTDSATICRYLGEGLKSRRRTAAIAESLIARLQPPTLDIDLEPAYARRLLPGFADSPVPAEHCPEPVRQRCDMLRDGLFYELGVRIPPIRFVPDDTLPAGTFRVRSGAVGGVPWPGLEPGRALVSVQPDMLALHGIDAELTSFPANDAPAALIAASDVGTLTALGLATWDPVGHMVLAAARDLRGNAGALLDIDAVESSLAQLEAAFPELVYAALEKISATDLTRVLRRLLASDVSIRNLRSILERLLAYSCVPVDHRREIPFDPRLPIDCRLDPLHPADQVDRYTEFVRSGLQLWLSHRSPGEAGTVLVQLLDPESVEKPILDELAYRQAYGLGRPLGSARLQQLRAAIRPIAEQGNAAILTVPQVASFLRAELRTEFPQLPVLSYQELAWDVNVQPLGRISI
jgi:hypothetical protein